MKRHLLVLLTVGAVGVAHAAPRATYQWTDPTKVGAHWQQPVAATVSKVIYLNNCSTGCTLSPGNDNATTNRSSIVNSTVNIPAYSGTAAQWTQVVNCVKATYAPFNVQIVTDRPAAGTNYHMAIVAGRAANAGQQSGVLGVSPFSCGYIPNAISFTFANEVPNDINDLCWTVSQETAHSWGLDHKYDNRDPMTYLQSGPAVKSFQNQSGSCGEYNARQCSCNYAGTGSQGMNSYALILSTFGAAQTGGTDTTPPTVAITSPAANAQVTPGFSVTATVTDATAVAKAELRLDGTLVGTDTTAPFSWTTPSTLAQGAHQLVVTGYDSAGNTATATVNVMYGQAPSCGDDNDCPSGQICSGGSCVIDPSGPQDPPDPSNPGGLGSPCSSGDDCASNQCASDGNGNSHCVEGCDMAAADCPTGFSCISAGSSGVCWPAEDDGGETTGCNAGGSGGIGLALGLLAFIARPRRRSPGARRSN